LWGLLYTDPEAAADRLTELADEELRAEIRDRLSEFAAANHRPTDRTMTASGFI